MNAPTQQPYVRPDVRAFLDFLNNLPGPKTHEVGAVEARKMMLAMREVADLPVGELAVQADIAIAGPGGGELPMRLFDARESREAGPLVLFFHGGGWVIGDIDTHAPFCAEMARALDLPVVSVDYRLAPEHPWPAAPEDCEAAARWAAAGAEGLGREVTGLVLAGDSAGGNLAIVTALALRDRPAERPVLAQFPIYPATDMETVFPSYEQFAAGHLLTREAMDWFGECYSADVAHWRGSPIKADQAGMPPTLVITASLDPIRDQGRAYAAATAAAGVETVFLEAAGSIHGFISLTKAIPSARADNARALAHLKQMIADAAARRAAA
ncbi:MAG: Esterase/lipase [uncultured Sphingomonadaceae bacterium]|uniref:Esterase/lipase n=1 Tax=uncultured Sphingomonadaceae bacterium TaxID=169976 RepID=A0A6J4SUT2_9SPHN|nr:MAG: Esterase/lipase [uncultured Sphingomonadaceae bacterium]